MSVAILERKEAEERKFNNINSSFVEDEEHNARIKKNYAMLINPETKLDEIIGRYEPEVNKTPDVFSRVQLRTAEMAEEAPVANVRVAASEKPYLVENARADAAIFRADNPVNRQILQSTVVAEQESEEEENEDLRPTPTTIQYKTGGVQKTAETGKIANTGKVKRVSLNKKEKIIIAVVVSVIVALIALIIVNSAIIANINNDMDALQSSLTTAKAAYAGVNDEINSFTENIIETVEEFAVTNGMAK